MWPQYVQLREELAGAACLSMHVVTSPATGLGSNAIHMIDLMAYLSRSGDIDVDASRLNVFPGPTKRNSLEFTGTLIATTRTGAVLTYTALPEGSNPLRLTIEAPEVRLLFEESADLGRRTDAKGGWQWRSFKASPIFQSRLTHLVVDQLIARGTCELTPYSESTALHVPMLRAMANRLAALGLPSDDGDVKVT
jgi:hypothetical protein